MFMFGDTPKRRRIHEGHDDVRVGRLVCVIVEPPHRRESPWGRWCSLWWAVDLAEASHADASGALVHGNYDAAIEGLHIGQRAGCPMKERSTRRDGIGINDLELAADESTVERACSAKREGRGQSRQPREAVACSGCHGNNSIGDKRRQPGIEKVQRMRARCDDRLCHSSRQEHSPRPAQIRRGKASGSRSRYVTK